MSRVQRPAIDCYVDFPPQILGALAQGRKKWKLILAVRDIGLERRVQTTFEGSVKSRRRKGTSQKAQPVGPGGKGKTKPKPKKPAAAQRKPTNAKKPAKPAKVSKPASSRPVSRPPPPKPKAPTKPLPPVPVKAKAKVSLQKQGKK